MMETYGAKSYVDVRLEQMDPARGVLLMMESPPTLATFSLVVTKCLQKY